MKIGSPGHLLREDILYKVFRKYLKRGEVLDTGCGSGSILLNLLTDGYKVSGIEFFLDFILLWGGFSLTRKEFCLI